MVEKVSNPKKERLFSALETIIIFSLAAVPLFMSFPYRVNIFLSWEGAYRLSQGQIPFKDFGIPMGYMYWVIPAFFFKIFGAQMITLIKAQVLINIISGFAFRSILTSLSIHPGLRLLSVLLYCVSFSFFNFWPWYNHTVIVYEMVGLAFLMKYLFANEKSWLLLSLSALFIFFSFFTKQDGGAMAFLICLGLLIYHCWYERTWVPVVVFLLSTIIVAFGMIAPLTRFNFNYWFNYGQAPHTTRLSLVEVIDEFLYSSQWIKFYLLVIVLTIVAGRGYINTLIKDKKKFAFLLLTTAILIEAAILQITSYTPPDNNIFFHSFAFAFICSALSKPLNIDFFQFKSILVVGVFLMLWWSGVFWKYIQAPVKSLLESERATNINENLVDRHTYILSSSSVGAPMNEWTDSGLESFRKIKMPKPTVDGINRLFNLAAIKNNKNLRVLNMTELTPLAVEIPFQLETGSNIPLWYHLGVSMFNKQAEEYEDKIRNRHYDVVLFEYVPTLNNFYPFRIRDSLIKHYEKTDSFPAPRRGMTQGVIEIFLNQNP